jgi:hypothetical protein
MTLPQGYKVFTDGSVLTADEIVGYLQQGILVFDDASERTTALTGNLREGMYSYLKSDNTTYVYDGTAWQRVGKQDVETEKNFQAFTGSGGTTVPAWATKMYYTIIGGGAAGNAGSGTSGGAGGAGGQVTQGNTSVTGGTSLTVTVGGSGASSSVAVSGGSTFTGTGGGGASGGSGGPGATAGANGTVPSAPFNTARYAGGGSGGSNFAGFNVLGGQLGGGAGGLSFGGTFQAGFAGFANSGGGGGGGGGADGGGTPGGGGTGGSGIVLLYFS